MLHFKLTGQTNTVFLIAIELPGKTDEKTSACTDFRSRGKTRIIHRRMESNLTRLTEGTCQKLKWTLKKTIKP